MNSSQFQQLIEKYISEESTHEEIEILRQMIKQPEYASELDKIMDQQLANNLASQSEYATVTERLKKMIDQEIAREEKKAPVRRLAGMRRWAAAAAIVIILGMAAFWWLSGKSSGSGQEQPTASQPVDIDPGMDGAILTLDDGTQVVLDSLGNGVIATQNGTRVLLTDGQLAYNANGGINGGMTYNTMTTPKGRQFRLLLQDGTKVWLNAASSIRYPTIFKGRERRVEVTGEVYFEVARNEKKPFYVRVNRETEVQVLGTHFNINSYTDEASINTTLLEGAVRIVNGNENAELQPGQQAQVKSTGAAVKNDHRIRVVSDVDVDRVMAWKNGVFDFNDANLKEVMRQLERWYDIDVVYEKGVPELEFIGKMNRDLTLSEVLRGLAVSEVHFRIEAGRKLVVMP